MAHTRYNCYISFFIKIVSNGREKRERKKYTCMLEGIIICSSEKCYFSVCKRKGSIILLYIVSVPSNNYSIFQNCRALFHSYTGLFSQFSSKYNNSLLTSTLKYLYRGTQYSYSTVQYTFHFGFFSYNKPYKIIICIIQHICQMSMSMHDFEK